MGWCNTLWRSTVHGYPAPCCIRERIADSHDWIVTGTTICRPSLPESTGQFCSTELPATGNCGIAGVQTRDLPKEKSHHHVFGVLDINDLTVQTVSRLMSLRFLLVVWMQTGKSPPAPSSSPEVPGTVWSKRASGFWFETFLHNKQEGAEYKTRLMKYGTELKRDKWNVNMN